jgi:transposase-like protein
MDIEKYERRLKELAKETYEKGGATFYTKKFKRALVRFMEETNMNAVDVALRFKIDYHNVVNWKKKYGGTRDCYMHGYRPLNDVVTRCKAVKEIIEDDAPISYIKKKYGVYSDQTIKNWVDKYRAVYNYYIDVLPPGVPYISQKVQFMEYFPYEE